VMEIAIKELEKTLKYEQRQLEEHKRKLDTLHEHIRQLEEAIELGHQTVESLEKALHTLKLMS
jgi:phage regulator Rha-like protein